MKKKIVSLVLVFALALALGIGGTVAWLTAQTGSVVNTFTIGDINIELWEHKYDLATDALTTEKTTINDNYEYVPGDTLPKDPFVVVKDDSEPCYVFVKIDETNNAFTADANGKFVNYTVDSSKWTALGGTYSGIYWCKLNSKMSGDQENNVLKDKTVTISSAITETIAEETLEKTKPVLTFTAYAIQSANLPGLTADDAANAVIAWKQLNGIQ